MASLYKKPIVKRDPRTGEKIKLKSKKWWGRYRDEHDVERRVPLATDKSAAQAMLNELVVKVERRKAGKLDPFEEHAKQPINEHVDDFEAHLRNKQNTAKHVQEVSTHVRKFVAGCKWSFLRDVSAGDVQQYLADRRAGGLSVQTSNHYLRGIKQFSRWLVRDRRAPDDPLIHLAMLNVQLDRRHDRRALSTEEFSRLIEAAEAGKPKICIPGPDRAMMYILAAWTGYRKGEIGSLTKRSLKLDDTPPTVTVAAAYSKRKRTDTQVLHPEVAARLREWLATKEQLPPDAPLFPVSDKVKGGKDRRTSKMMLTDLKAARKKWIEEGKTPEEKEARKKSDFLSYCDENGLYADFHANRHTFITNLSRVGVKPRTAQSLARHSDIRLTMGVYTHIALMDQAEAIETLPAPPPMANGNGNGKVKANGSSHSGNTSSNQGNGSEKPSAGAEKDGGTAESGEEVDREKVPVLVPSGAENGAVRLASPEYESASVCTETDLKGGRKRRSARGRKPANGREFCTDLHQSAPPRRALHRATEEVRPAGFEPATLGSEDRCAIQLRHGRLLSFAQRHQQNRTLRRKLQLGLVGGVLLLLRRAMLRPL